VKIPYFGLIFTAAFLYFAIEQRRRQPMSKVWIAFLIASLFGAAAVILEILLPPKS
jgi:predicted branched-subunit amino acid permease